MQDVSFIPNNSCFRNVNVAIRESVRYNAYDGVRGARGLDVKGKWNRAEWNNLVSDTILSILHQWITGRALSGAEIFVKL